MQRFSIICLILFAGFGFVRADDVWDTKLAAYKETQKRPSLWKRTVGREELAMTRDARAIDILAQDYAKPEKPKDQVQFLVASLVTRYFTTKDFVDALEAFRTAHDRAEDAWLWYRCLSIYQGWRGVADVIAIAKDPERDIFLRAAAIEAIAKRPEVEVLAMVKDLLNGLPDHRQRWVLVESCMSALRWKTAQLKTDDFRLPAEQLARMLDQDAVPEHTKLVIARTFKRMFSADHAYTVSAPWLEILKGDKPGQRSRTLAAPTFLGLQAEGNRICYVIDMSDSMLMPLTLQEKEDLKNPVTGHNKHDGEKPAPKQDEDIAKLPWDKIVTRFDAAREFLKLSLKRLQPDQYFAVAWFGTQAGLLEESDGMVKVTDKRLEKVIAELDAIKPGKPTEMRKEGTLRGLTNLHGGIQRAFQCKGKGLIKDYEYVDWLGFSQGADTIFLLSDGKQSWSDWDCIDKTDAADIAGDPENGSDLPGGKSDYAELHFYGPYVDQRHMLDDFERMNLFRKAEIHCIGIGEAEASTLKAIAQIGNGQVRVVGK